jgi:hypothetical protein
VKGFRRTINDQSTKGCGIHSLRGGSYNKVKARAVDSVGTVLLI